MTYIVQIFDGPYNICVSKHGGNHMKLSIQNNSFYYDSFRLIIMGKDSSYDDSFVTVSFLNNGTVFDVKFLIDRNNVDSFGDILERYLENSMDI